MTAGRMPCTGCRAQCTLVPAALQEARCGYQAELRGLSVTREAEGGSPHPGTSWRQQEHSRHEDGSFLVSEHGKDGTGAEAASVWGERRGKATRPRRAAGQGGVPLRDGICRAVCEVISDQTAWRMVLSRRKTAKRWKMKRAERPQGSAGGCWMPRRPRPGCGLVPGWARGEGGPSMDASLSQ